MYNLFKKIKERSSQIKNFHSLLTLKGSNIALAFTLTIQGDFRPSSFEIRASVFEIINNASSSLVRFIKKAKMTVNDM